MIRFGDWSLFGPRIVQGKNIITEQQISSSFTKSSKEQIQSTLGIALMTDVSRRSANKNSGGQKAKIKEAFLRISDGNGYPLELQLLTRNPNKFTVNITQGHKSAAQGELVRPSEGEAEDLSKTEGGKKLLELMDTLIQQS